MFQHFPFFMCILDTLYINDQKIGREVVQTFPVSVFYGIYLIGKFI